MPDKPLWLDRLPEAVQQLAATAEPWVDRATLQSLLGVGRRRAQQLLSPLARRRIGTSSVASRDELIDHLQRIASGEPAYYDGRRRQQLWAQLEEARRDWARQPPLFVEVSPAQIRRIQAADFAGLPAGVELAPGSISLRFRTPQEALQQLAALVMAIGQNRQAFDDRVALPTG